MGPPSAEPCLPTWLRVKRYWFLKITIARIRSAITIRERILDIQRFDVPSIGGLSKEAHNHPEQFAGVDFTDAVRQLERLLHRSHALRDEALAMLSHESRRWDALNAEAQRWQLRRLVTPAAPPALAEVLFSLLLPPKGVEEILGDMSQSFRYIRNRRGSAFAAFWYWIQGVKTVGAIAGAAIIDWLVSREDR
jgi:hypothetical protein